MNIIMPSDSEKQQSIDKVLSHGLQGKEIYRKELMYIFHNIGLKTSFFGIVDALVLALIFSVSITGFIAFITFSVEIRINSFNVYVIAALISPITYFSFYFFTNLKERITGTYEILATCRYNISYLTVIRLILISVINLVIVLIASLFIGSYVSILTISYFNIVGVSISAALVYGIVMLLVLILPNTKITQYIVPPAWIILGLVLLAASHKLQHVVALDRIPAAVIISGLFILAVVYCFEFHIYIKKVLKGNTNHAFS